MGVRSTKGGGAMDESLSSSTGGRSDSVVARRKALALRSSEAAERGFEALVRDLHGRHRRARIHHRDLLLGKRGHQIVDVVGRGHVVGQGVVDVVVGDEALLPTLGDQLQDLGAVLHLLLGLGGGGRGRRFALGFVRIELGVLAFGIAFGVLRFGEVAVEVFAFVVVILVDFARGRLRLLGGLGWSGLGLGGGFALGSLGASRSLGRLPLRSCPWPQHPWRAEHSSSVQADASRIDALRRTPSPKLCSCLSSTCLCVRCALRSPPCSPLGHSFSRLGQFISLARQFLRALCVTTLKCDLDLSFELRALLIPRSRSSKGRPSINTRVARSAIEFRGTR